MSNNLLYYTNEIPITGGAYLKPDYTYIYLSKVINFSVIVLNIILVLLVAYFVYTLLTMLYRKYQHVMFLIKDTNEKVNNLNNYIQMKSTENRQPTIKRLQLKSKSKENVYIVDTDGTIVEQEKTED